MQKTGFSCYHFSVSQCSTETIVRLRGI